MALTTKQRRFVEAYNGNATEAAILAGYSKKTARQIGQNLLTKVDIQAAIQEREQARLTPLIAAREQRQIFWSTIMRDTSADMRDRLRASELLGKSEGDFLDRSEFHAPDAAPPDTGPIEVQFVTPSIMDTLKTMTPEQIRALVKVAWNETDEQGA